MVAQPQLYVAFAARTAAQEHRPIQQLAQHGRRPPIGHVTAGHVSTGSSAGGRFHGRPRGLQLRVELVGLRARALGRPSGVSFALIDDAHERALAILVKTELRGHAAVRRVAAREHGRVNEAEEGAGREQLEQGEIVVPQDELRLNLTSNVAVPLEQQSPQDASAVMFARRRARDAELNERHEPALVRRLRLPAEDARRAGEQLAVA